MEVLHHYRELARNNTFKPEACWLSLANQKAAVCDFLSECQNGTNINSRIHLHHLLRATKETSAEASRLNGMHLKLVVHNSNSNISFKSYKAGFTTNLVFLFFSRSESDWYMYSYAHGRFASRSFLSTDGYPWHTTFISINQKNTRQNIKPRRSIDIKS